MPKLHHYAWVVLLLGTAARLWAEDIMIDVGGTLIIIPAPEGFHRSDGRSSKYDAIQTSLITRGNQILASFCTEDELAQILLDKIPNQQVNYNVQLMKSLVGKSVSERSFGELKSTLRQRTSKLNPELSDILRSIENEASQAISSETSEKMRLKLSAPEYLGIFDETQDSVSISALSRFDLNLGQGDTMVGVTAASLSWLRIKNRVLAVYCTVPYQRKGDIEATRKNVLRWRDAILAGNREGLQAQRADGPLSQMNAEAGDNVKRVATPSRSEGKMDWRKIIDKAIVGAFLGFCWLIVHVIRSWINKRRRS